MNVVIKFPEKISWSDLTELLDQMEQYKNGHLDQFVGFEMTLEKGIMPEEFRLDTGTAVPCRQPAGMRRCLSRLTAFADRLRRGRR